MTKCINNPIELIDNNNHCIDEKTYECEKCYKIFESPELLIKHKKSKIICDTIQKIIKNTGIMARKFEKIIDDTDIKSYESYESTNTCYYCNTKCESPTGIGYKTHMLLRRHIETECQIKERLMEKFEKYSFLHVNKKLELKRINKQKRMMKKLEQINLEQVKSEKIKSTNNKSTNNKSTNNKSTNNKSTNNKSTNNKSTNNKSTNNKSTNNNNLSDDIMNKLINKNNIIIKNNTITSTKERNVVVNFTGSIADGIIFIDIKEI